MKKTIWMPLVLGGALGLLDLVSLVVNFLIPLGPLSGTGPQEILTTISAALGGPLGLLVTSFFQDLGIYYSFLTFQLSPEQMLSTGILFSLTDFSAHLIALFAVAYSYRFLYQRAKKGYIFYAGWILIVIVYYGLLVLMQSTLIGLVISDKPSLSMLYRNNLPEFLVVTFISTLIWIALPRRFRKPLWYEVQPAALPAENRTVYEDPQP